MNIEWIVFFITAIVILLLIFLKGFFDEKKKQKDFEKSLYSEYGKRPDRHYEYNQFQNLTHYYKRKLQNGKHSVIVDDITWNDLDMDNVYMLMNHTWSQPGDEYLYDCLRTPVSNKEEMEERERLITYFSEHEMERVKLQLSFARMGKTGKVSLSDYLFHLKELPEEKNGIHILCLLLGIFATALIFLNPPIGFGFFIFTLIFNVALYFKRKGHVEPYITTFAYLLRLMKNVDVISGSSIAAIDVYTKELKSLNKEMKQFRKNSYILMSAQSFTGNLMELVLDYLRMYLHLDLIKFNSMLHDLNRKQDQVFRMMEIIGFLDTMVSIGEFRHSIPYYCIPDFLSKEETSKFHVEELFHPILEHPVSSSIVADCGVLITGSNASGKSTFLKSAAICAILAETIHTATAKSYHASFFRVASSMALNDNIFSGESYYMVEIRSLKRILDLSKDEIPLLCFIDEVLRGTNTVERIAASAQILKSLGNTPVICFAATHDIELTMMLENEFDNYHFTERVEGKDVIFPYKLIEGRAQSRNAIQLLNMIGYDEAITRRAEWTCENFIQTGTWKI